MTIAIERERRCLAGELRAGAKHRTLVGYAAKFNARTDIIDFYEEIVPGAFADAMRTGDPRALWNHDHNHVIGRKSAGTLRLKEDSVGLRFEIDLPDTQVGRDTWESVKRGDISGMSFAFAVPAGGDEWTKADDGKPLRRIRKIDPLFEVSPVTWPAYESTEVAARTEARAKQMADSRHDGHRALALAKVKLEKVRLELGLDPVGTTKGPASSGASVEELRRIVEKNRPANSCDLRYSDPGAVDELRRELRKALRDRLSYHSPLRKLLEDARQTARHEASHAVLGFLDGAGVRELGINAKHVHGRRAYNDPPVRVAGGFCEFRRPVRSALPFLAGAAIEGGSIDSKSIDYREAMKVLRKESKGGFELPNQMRKAETDVRRYWQVIDKLTQELVYHVRLDGDEAERIIATALGVRRAS